jgi:hypothetical protein
MADQDTPNRAANMEKAEGDRSRSNDSTVDRAGGFATDQGTIPDSESSSERSYHDDGDNAGGISNRPLDEEAENQDALPDRGNRQADEASRRNEDIER